MMNHISARKRVFQTLLTPRLIWKISKSIFPKRNNYVHDIRIYEDLLPELNKFGIKNHGQLKRLLTKHRRALLRDDRSKLSLHEIRFYIEMFGSEFVNDAVRRQYWFGYPGLIRHALESEFGEIASVFESDVIA